jgi:hypothetical protein
MKFDEYCGRLRFFADVNGDGQITITDVVAWVKFLFFVPAKLAMALFDEMPPLRNFFESSCDTGMSLGGAVFSLFVWLIVWLIVWAMFEGLVESRQASQ